MSVKAIVIDDSPNIRGFKPPFVKGEIVHITPSTQIEECVIVEEYPFNDIFPDNRSGYETVYNKRRFREISDLTFDDLVTEDELQDINENILLTEIKKYILTEIKKYIYAM